MTKKIESPAQKRGDRELLEEVFQMSEKVRKAKSGDINLSKAMVYHGDQSVIFPRTIALVQGQTGSHKSRLAQNIASAIIARNQDPSLTMGFEFRGKEQPIVVYVDTERNPEEQFALAVQSILRNAGYEKEDDPESFKYIPLQTFATEDRIKALNTALVELRKNNSGRHLVLIMDVVSDFVSNINDEEQSTWLATTINRMCTRHHATAICVIHENPNKFSTKPRGHLGTELFNKSTITLQITRDEGSVFKVSSLKTRNTGPLNPFYVVFDEEAQNLVQLEAHSTVKSKRQNTDDEVAVLVGTLLEGEMKKEDLVRLIKPHVEVGEQRIGRALNNLVSEKRPIQVMLDQKVLMRKPGLKEAIFYLAGISNPSESALAAA